MHTKSLLPRYLSAYSLGLALLIFSGVVFAQHASPIELNLDDLASVQISSVSKYVQPTREAPAAVEVISRAEISRYGWRTLSEALNSLPGLYFSNDRAYDYLGGRGFAVPGDYNTRYLLLIDGSRVNDYVYGQASIGRDFSLDMALIARIEFVPGPGSAIYGGNAIFGVINVITRRGSDISPLSVSSLASSDGWCEGRIAGSQRYDSGAVVMMSYSAANRLGSDTRYADPGNELTIAGGQSSPDGIARDMDHERVRRLFGRYEHGGLTITGRYAERNMQPSSPLYGSLFNDPALQLEDAGAALTGRYQRRVSDDGRFELRLDYSRVTYKGTYPFESGTGLRYLNEDRSVGTSWQGDFRYFYSGLEAHQWLFGVEGQMLNARQRNDNLNGVANPAINIVSNAERLGFYVQDEWRFAPDWRLSLGVRHDRPSEAEAMTSPRVGLVWLPAPATSLKLLYGQAYRLPGPYERDYANGNDYLSNTSLKPEEISTLEAVWEQRYGPAHSLRLAVFDYTLKRLIGLQQLPGNQFQYQNGAEVKAHGVESSWHTKWQSGARVDASVAYTRTADAHGDALSNAPRWLGKLRGMLPVWQNNWWLALETYASSRTDYVWNGQRLHQPGGGLVNLTLTGERVWAGLDVQLRIRNLFDRRFAYPASDEVASPSVPGYGLVGELGFSYAF